MIHLCSGRWLSITFFVEQLHLKTFIKTIILSAVSFIHLSTIKLEQMLQIVIAQIQPYNSGIKILKYF